MKNPAAAGKIGLPGPLTNSERKKENMKVQIEDAKLIRETEKVILLNVGFGDEFRKDIWFPKTQIEVKDGQFFAPEWLLAAKADEVGTNVPNINIIAPVIDLGPVKISEKAAKKITRGCFS